MTIRTLRTYLREKKSSMTIQKHEARYILSNNKFYNEQLTFVIIFILVCMSSILIIITRVYF
ncbi:hypothetical protein C2G38_2118254 [Gigaspora rosea]|uniref:Uncharacterized protein n=1 Tax=Gigaspora rosea TaxID=44941 RepID=A0A397U5G9_9GLOM|nr:hypothetical protein C2G38_2118254 [Gigaspora rosea]